MKRLTALFGTLASLIAGPALAVQIIITSGTTWVVPADWNNLANTVELVGAGAVSGGCAGDCGGGGGAYAKKTNVVLTAGATVNIQVGVTFTGTVLTDTWFSSAAFLKAQGGAGVVGGSAASSVGTVKYGGGNSGALDTLPDGGGGAGGPNGAGANGVLNTGGNADAGFGGAGGTLNVAGGAGTEWGAAGSGGGGGPGANGGAYGGGAGDTNGGGLKQGGNGVIVINYQPYRRATGGAF